ncbi:hypothetical protein F0562_011299 [Nyssa sinensis]|uniref:Disease resistance protein RPM1-like n=1 Tax=Nyssa sinensis TaxID=561372 RepID=A0A5J5A4C7_9ASTE|nr:hypothetical protein F0562_011299 [Nyssa sinensis]
MADGAVNFLLDKLTTILLQNASLLGDAQKEIEEIKLELESMRSFIRDAERRKEMSEQVETWVKQVRLVAYEIEDIVDEFMHYKEMARDRKGIKDFVQDVVNLPKNVTARHRISSKLQKVKAKVLEVSERSKRYVFDTIDEGRSNNASIDRWQYHGESSIFVEEDELVGMDENREKLLEWLNENDQRRTIISIVGMGGLGKTTLVTKVYNDQIIKRHFDCWAWISVSQTYGVRELLRSMIKEFFETNQVMDPSNLGSMKYMQLVGTLNDYLHQKRYVVVLDDVWSIDLWSKIRGAFPNNKYGSRIILTTRNENVAFSVGTGSRVHRLQPLQDKDAWALFCKKAFWSDPDRSCPKELEALAQVIMKKCEGLPLAIVAIGGLMCSRNQTVVEWKKVYDSLNWQLSNHPLLEQVKGILLLSFNDLPFYLKHCFLYCCVFRDGYPIKRKKLIRLWVAEGFIAERKGMTMEEVAEDYLTELIFRSMIQATETNDAGRVKTCRVHDVMRELAMTTSEKENFCTAYYGQESRLEGKIHRLSVFNIGENIRLSTTICHHLRSFFVFETDMFSSFSLNSVLSKFKLLRVLDYMEFQLKPYQAPAGIWDIRSLQTLAFIEAEERLIQQIGNLTELKRLNITKLRAIDGPKLCASIQKLTNLHRLGLMASTEEEELQLEALLLPPIFLQKLTLVGQLNRLPHWLGSLASLTHLYLVSSQLEEDILSSLHTLSSLVFLELKKAYGGRLLHFRTGWFPNLNKLNLQELLRLDSVTVEEGALPSIREMYLSGCWELKLLPQGIEHLTSLQKLHLEEMPEEFVQRLRSDTGEDQTKVQHITRVYHVFLMEQTRVIETLH